MNVYRAQHKLEGGGFEVKRPFPAAGIKSVGPFILLDQIGPLEVQPGKGIAAPTHPHVGIETLTYFLDGEGMHLDSIGNQAVTGAGEAQWMRSGRGIVHDEGPTERMQTEGGLFHAVQFWINMPGDRKHEAPKYSSFKSEDFPVISTESAELKVIAGTFNGRTGPLHTFAEPHLAHGRLEAYGLMDIAFEENIQMAVYVLTGAAQVNGSAVHEGTLAYPISGINLELNAGSESLEFVILGGPPIEDNLVHYGPFVANSEREMQTAISNYQQGKFGNIASK